MSRPKRGPDLLALGLGALAILVRLRIPDAEEEAFPMKQALGMWGWAKGHVTLDPGTAGWPSLSFYVHLLLQHLHFWAGRLVGLYADRYDYFVATRLDIEPLMTISRAFSVAVAGAIVWAGARLARHLAGVEGALLAGLLLIASPLLFDYSHLVTPDILVALFTALAVGRIVAIQQRGRMSDYVWTGIWIGLGISSKYTPVLLLPAVFVAHLSGPEREGRKRRSLLERDPWVAALAAVLSFAATSPYVILDLPVAMRDFGQQAVHMSVGHFGAGSQSGLVFYWDVLNSGLGWTGLLVCLLGLAWGSVVRRRPWWALVACVVPYYLGIALLKAQFPRYVLPLLAPLAVGASGAVIGVRALAWPKARGAKGALLAVLTAIAIIPAATASWRSDAEGAKPTTHRLATRFVAGLLARGQPHVAAEMLSVMLPSARDAEGLDPEVMRRLSADQRRRLSQRTTHEIDRIPMYSVRPELSAFYYDLRHYTAYDYIVTSGAVRARYESLPGRFPVQARFYQDLDRYATLVRRFGPDQGARGTEIRIYAFHDGGAALLRDRGEIPFGPSGILSEQVNMPDFVDFAEGVVRAAWAKGRWAKAERYVQLLLDVEGGSGLDDEGRAALTGLIDTLRARAAADDSAGIRRP